MRELARNGPLRVILAEKSARGTNRPSRGEGGFARQNSEFGRGRGILPQTSEVHHPVTQHCNHLPRRVKLFLPIFPRSSAEVGWRETRTGAAQVRGEGATFAGGVGEGMYWRAE